MEVLKIFATAWWFFVKAARHGVLPWVSFRSMRAPASMRSVVMRTEALSSPLKAPVKKEREEREEREESEESEESEEREKREKREQREQREPRETEENQYIRLC
jgi:hypothetical protein